MSNNLNKLYALPELLHARGCPVIIVAGVLYKLEGTDEKILVQLKFKNMGDKIVKAIKVDIQTFDVSGNPVDEKLEHQYLDLSIGFNSEYADRKGVLLKTKTIRSFNVKITEIVFSNGDIWSNNIEFQPLPKPADIKEKLGAELAEQYKREIGKYAKYEPFPHEDIWCCTCGEYNRIDESFCHYCKTNRIKQFESLDHSHLSKNKEIFEKEKQIKAEKQAQEERIQKEKNKKVAKISGITLSIFAIVLVLVVALATNIKKNNNYNKALSMMNDGNYSNAIVIFEELGDFKASEENLLECRYQIACEYIEVGKCDKAIEIFEDLGDYKDSSEQINIAENEKKYLYAISLLGKAGDHTEAYKIFEALNEYKDSKKYLNRFVERVVKTCAFGVDSKHIDYIYNEEGYLICKEYYGSPCKFSYSKNKSTMNYTCDGNIYTEKYDENGNVVFFKCTYNDEEIQKSLFTYDYNENGEVEKQFETCYEKGGEYYITRTYVRNKINTICEEKVKYFVKKQPKKKYMSNSEYTYKYEYEILGDGHTKIISTAVYVLGWVYAPSADEKSNKINTLSSFKPYMERYLYAYED